MRILFLGDIFGVAGLEAVNRYLPRLKSSLSPDFIVVNGENAANGAGITSQICHDLFELGVDCVTTGNHVWDQREALSYIEKEPRLLRPLNFSSSAPGRGMTIVENSKGQKLGVINVMAQVFMPPIDNPFAAVEMALGEMRLKENVDGILVDIHAEATSEKMGMGHFCDGYVSLVVGTHTHVPTADARVLEQGTAYHTDAGMCGCYDSIIGNDKDISLRFMLEQVPGERKRQSDGEGSVCGTFVVTNDENGLAEYVSAVRMGPHLKDELPEMP